MASCFLLFSLPKLSGFHGVLCANTLVLCLCYSRDVHKDESQQQLLDLDNGNLGFLKGQITPKSKIHIFLLTCSAIYQSKCFR